MLIVRRAQLGTNPGQPLKEKENEQAWRRRGTARPSFLLAEAARSECAPSMRAVKDSLAASLSLDG